MIATLPGVATVVIDDLDALVRDDGGVRVQDVEVMWSVTRNR